MAYEKIVFSENTEKCAALSAVIAEKCIRELKDLKKSSKNEIYTAPEVVAAAMKIAYSEMCRINEGKSTIIMER